MTDRNYVLRTYRQWLAERWQDGQLTLDEVHALKVFCEVHAVTAEEHEQVAKEVGVERRELTDEESQNLADWLRARRKGEPSAPLERLLTSKALDGTPWKTPLPPPPTRWQSILAGVATAALVTGTLLIVISR